MGSRLFGWFLFFALCIALFAVLRKPRPPHAAMSIDGFRDQLLAGNVRQVDVVGQGLRGALKTPQVIAGQEVTRFTVQLPEGLAADWGLMQWLLENRNGATVGVDVSGNVLQGILVPLIPWLLIFGFIWFFVFRQIRTAGQRPKEPLPVVIVQPPAAGQADK